MVKSQRIAQRVLGISDSRNSVKAVWPKVSVLEVQQHSEHLSLFLRKAKPNSSEPYFLGLPQQTLSKGISESKPNKEKRASRMQNTASMAGIFTPPPTKRSEIMVSKLMSSFLRTSSQAVTR